MKTLFLMISAALLFNFTNVVQANETSAEYTEKTLNVVVTSNEPSFTIKLKSNPTTGYRWFLREYDTDLMSPLKHRFEKEDNKSLGAGGFEIWTFRIKKIGFTVPQQSIIRFVYSRPWQGAEGSTPMIFRVSTMEKK